MVLLFAARTNEGKDNDDNGRFVRETVFRLQPRQLPSYFIIIPNPCSSSSVVNHIGQILSSIVDSMQVIVIINNFFFGGDLEEVIGCCCF